MADMETLKEKLRQTGRLLDSLGAFEGEVRSLAAECDVEAAEGATARELPGIIRASMNEVADNVVALANALTATNAKVDGLRIKSITAANATDAYAQAAQAEVLEGGYTLIVWATPSGTEGNTILQTRYGTNYITQVTFYEAAAGRKCKVRNASKSNGAWTMQAWQNVILPVDFQYNSSTRAMQYKDAISGQWTNMAVLPENGINSAQVNNLIETWVINNIDEYVDLSDLESENAALKARLDALEWAVNERVKIEAWLAEDGVPQEDIEELMADGQFGRRTFAEVQAMHAKLSTIGYTARETVECITDVPDLTDADIAYAKEIYDAWDPATTSLSNKWASNKSLRIFPHIDTSNVTRLYRTWYNCINLAYIPLLDTTKIKTSDRAFANTYIRRMQPFDWSNWIGSMESGLFTGAYNCVIWPKRIVMPNATNLYNMFFGCELLDSKNCPEIVFDRTKVVDMSQMFSDSTRLSHIPFTDFGVCTNLHDMFSKALAPMGDLGGTTLRWNTNEDIAISGFFSNPFEGCGPMGSLPQFADGINVRNMKGFAEYCFERIVPDYTNIQPVHFGAAFRKSPKYNVNSLERVDGLNFSRVQYTMYAESPIFCYQTNVPNNRPEWAHGNLRYMRIVNLGQGPCTLIDLSGTYRWGDGSDENKQSLLDSLLTNSYDRTSAEMEPAQLILPKQVWARLTTEQQAEVTAKGFTVTTSNY